MGFDIQTPMVCAFHYRSSSLLRLTLGDEHGRTYHLGPDGYYIFGDPAIGTDIRTHRKPDAHGYQRACKMSIQRVVYLRAVRNNELH